MKTGIKRNHPTMGPLAARIAKHVAKEGIDAFSRRITSGRSNSKSGHISDTTLRRVILGPDERITSSIKARLEVECATIEREARIAKKAEKAALKGTTQVAVVPMPAFVAPVVNESRQITLNIGGNIVTGEPEALRALLRS